MSSIIGLTSPSNSQPNPTRGISSFPEYFLQKEVGLLFQLPHLIQELSVIEKELPNGMRDFYRDRRRFNELVSHHGYRAEVVKYVRLVKDEYSPLVLREIDEG